MILTTEERIAFRDNDKWVKELYNKDSDELTDILKYWADGIAYIDVTPDQFVDPPLYFLVAWSDALRALHMTDKYYIHKLEVKSQHGPTSTLLYVLTQNNDINDTLKNHLGDIKILTPRALCHVYME